MCHLQMLRSENANGLQSLTLMLSLIILLLYVFSSTSSLIRSDWFTLKTSSAHFVSNSANSMGFGSEIFVYEAAWSYDCSRV